jgi:2-polyprenyl-3-methyl-5-hydroxy-6-metoxy-1,4-benzoquinol methylase
MPNAILQELAQLEIVDATQVVPFFPRVRDRDDVSVLRCTRSGVIFLSTADHIDDGYYRDKRESPHPSHQTRAEGLKTTHADDHRRYRQFKHLITDKKYLDVGSGLGGILDLFRPQASEIAAVEPHAELRALLAETGYKTYESIEAIPSASRYDTVTLFHVFEHLTRPLRTLQEIRSRMTDGGKVIIEVPHANDALIATFDLEAFKAFTFWGEHLILHTRASLAAFLRAAGFRNISVEGFQRYPLANHLYWLQKGEPRGHEKLPQFRNEAVETAYANLLKTLDQTDTIIAVAER